MLKVTLSKKNKSFSYTPGQEIRFSSKRFGWETEDEAVSMCRNRILCIAGIFVLAYFIIILRIFNVCLVDGIQINRDNFSYYKPNKNSTSPVHRANIVDRNGVVIATNLPTVNLFTNPKKVSNPVVIATKLAEIFEDGNYEDFYTKLTKKSRFVYLKRNISPQQQGIEMGVDMGYRLPLFDIEVTAQKQSPYSKMAQNELALQFVGAGFFNPEIADQALACLDMMDFDRKHFIMQKIAQNGTMYQQIMQMQEQMVMLASLVDQTRGSNLAQQLAAQFGGGQPVAPIDGQAPASKVNETEALGGEEKGEATHTKKARQRVAESTSPT